MKPENPLLYSFIQFTFNNHNDLLTNQFREIVNNKVIFNLSYVNNKIVPFDEVIDLLNINSDLIIHKYLYYSNELVYSIKLKNFRFTNISNVVNFDTQLDVEYKYESIEYINHKLTILQKRQLKYKKLFG